MISYFRVFRSGFDGWLRAEAPVPASALEEAPLAAGTEIVKTASNIISLAVMLAALAVVITVAVLIVRGAARRAKAGKVKEKTGEAMEKAGEAMERALKYEKKGEYVSAGILYEKMGEAEKAAFMFEKGRNFGRAAHVYESMGHEDKAAGLYKRAGESLKAAQLYIKNGKYLEAAAIFKNKGDRLRAAQALEMFGNKEAAAKEYGEAGQHLKAARLYKEEKMYGEAGQMYLLSLGGQELNALNMGKFYAYAAFLMLANETEKAAEVYRSIVHIDSNYRDVTKKLAAMAASKAARAEEKTTKLPPEERAEAPGEKMAVEFVYLGDEDLTGGTQAADIADIESTIQSELEKRGSVEAEEPGVEEPAIPLMQGETPLRSIIKSGRMDPKYSMRMWSQILKTLSKEHGSNLFFGRLSPDRILIDMQNNVRIEKSTQGPDEYTAPEVIAGNPPDEQADIYPLGVILFELVTGSLEHLNEKTPSSIAKEIPEWLDELIMRCLERDRRYRFKGLEEIYAKLLELRSVIG